MLGLEKEIRMKIEIIKSIGETKYNEIRDIRPELSILEIHQLVVAAKSICIPFGGISNAEYRYRTVQSPLYNKYIGRGDRCKHHERVKSINDYCEKNRYSEIAEKKLRWNFWKSVAISTLKFTLLFATLIVLTILASAL